MSSLDANSTTTHGWTAIPHSLSQLIASRSNPSPSQPVKLSDILLPDNPLVQAVTAYAREHLPVATFNHSMRVFYFGQAITTQHFPQWSYSPETLLITALLHDIGTTHTKTHLSFEFSGAITALELLKTSLNADAAQAEAVCETIIRHQDLGETGMMTTLTGVIQLATVLDNCGLHAELVHHETRRRVVEAWPREGWTGCFAAVVREECERKPWANTTRIEGFAEMVEGNVVMREFEEDL